jgi:hypothetical protein
MDSIWEWYLSGLKMNGESNQLWLLSAKDYKGLANRGKKDEVLRKKNCF